MVDMRDEATGTQLQCNSCGRNSCLHVYWLPVQSQPRPQHGQGGSLTSGTTTILLASTPDRMKDWRCHSDGTHTSVMAFSLHTHGGGGA